MKLLILRDQRLGIFHFDMCRKFETFRDGLFNQTVDVFLGSESWQSDKSKKGFSCGLFLNAKSNLGATACFSSSPKVKIEILTFVEDDLRELQGFWSFFYLPDKQSLSNFLKIFSTVSVRKLIFPKNYRFDSSKQTVHQHFLVYRGKFS